MEGNGLVTCMLACTLYGTERIARGLFNDFMPDANQECGRFDFVLGVCQCVLQLGRRHPR